MSKKASKPQLSALERLAEWREESKHIIPSREEERIDAVAAAKSGEALVVVRPFKADNRQWAIGELVPGETFGRWKFGRKMLDPPNIFLAPAAHVNVEEYEGVAHFKRDHDRDVIFPLEQALNRAIVREENAQKEIRDYEIWLRNAQDKAAHFAGERAAAEAELLAALDPPEPSS